MKKFLKIERNTNKIISLLKTNIQVKDDEKFFYKKVDDSFELDPSFIYSYKNAEITKKENLEYKKYLYKQNRQKLVDEIVVTTASGKSFDGDEKSQERMSRAVQVLEDGEVIKWRLADNSDVEVTKEELKEALKLSGIRQAQIWFEE